jgi:hypothetical protein
MPRGPSSPASRAGELFRKASICSATVGSRPEGAAGVETLGAAFDARARGGGVVGAVFIASS